MSRKLAEVIRSCLKLELNFISECEENILITEVNKKLKYMRWNEEHFDGKIKNYREYLSSNLQQFPKLYEITNTRVIEQMMNREILPVHILELRHDGLIFPHIDNIHYSGKIVAGLSLQRDSVLTISDSTESVNIIIPRRSFYRQM